MSNEQTVIDFFERWDASFESMVAAFEATLADDCRWDQRPMGLTLTRRDAIRFLERGRRFMGLETVKVDVLNVASTGPVVLCERVDHLRRHNGSVLVSAPVVGALRFAGGHIVEWKEYFDAIDLTRQLCANGIRGLFGRQRRI